MHLSHLTKKLISDRRRLNLFYMIQYFGVGIFGPYLAFYLTSKNLTGWQFGLLLALMPIVRIIAQPAWSFFSDLTQSHRCLLSVACLTTALSVSFYPFVDHFFGLALVTVAYAFLNAPIGTLCTTIVLEYLERNNQQDEFGLIRLWGSIGFALTALLMGGFIIDRLSDMLPWLFCGSMLILAGVAWSLPEGQKRIVPHWLHGITILDGRAQLLRFLLAVLFLGAAIEIGMQYLAIYMDMLQASGWIIGFAIAFQAIMEVPLMARVPKWMKQYGLPVVLLAGIVILPFRWFSYIYIQEPLLVIPTQVLHSLSIVSLMVVGVKFVDQQIPHEWRATGQSIYTTTMGGIGPAIGLLIAGSIFDGVNIDAVWILNTLITVIGVLLLITVFYPGKYPVPAGVR